MLFYLCKKLFMVWFQRAFSALFTNLLETSKYQFILAIVWALTLALVQLGIEN